MVAARHLAVVLALALTAMLVTAVAAPAPADAAPTHYVEVSDGTLIAINVAVPEHCTEAHPCPTVFEMAGYENGSADGRTPSGDLADATGLPLPLQSGSRASHSVFFDDRYVTIQASLRGTGCSTGEFDLFSWRSALDGKEVIDGWVAQQPWSNGDVAIFGHSYSGITGTMIAATRPEHLRAISVSGLIGDIYRDIAYLGGVTNYGFPLLWTGAIRPAYDLGGGVGGGLFPPAESSPQCAANQAGKSRAVLADPLVHGLDDTDSAWYQARSLVTSVDHIEVPVHATGAYQDEQTGPRGPTNVFDHLPDDVSRRLVLTNGDHGTQTDENVRKDRVAWLDYWLLGAQRADLGFDIGTTSLTPVFGPRSRVTETSRIVLGYQSGDDAVGEIHSDGWPLSQTDFTDAYVTAGEQLTFDRDAVEATSYPWVNGSKRQSYSYQAGVDNGGEISSPTGPDEVQLVLPAVDEPLVIAGPITANLRIASSAPDTELFVQLIDRAPDGELLYLQRGLLKASHRAIDAAASWYTDDGRIYRPHRPHTNPELITPGEVVEYLVEIFPVGHVLLPGHELVVKVHAPPADDNDYAYIQKTLPGVNTLHTSPEAPSSLMLPLVPLDEVVGFDPDVGPCAYNDMRCLS